MWDKIKDWFEEGIDNTLGKPFRKGLEQFGHFTIYPGGVGGVPGAAIVMGLDAIPGVTASIWWHILGGVITAAALAAWREYKQNIGDEPDDSTIYFVDIGGRVLPVNWDMVVDWCVSAAGGMLAGIGFFFI